MNSKNKSILTAVALIVFIDSLGIGLILPIAPRLISEVAHVNLSQAAEIGGFLVFAYAGMQFLFAPIIGGLSDRFGRRPILLSTLFLLRIDYAIMAIAPSLGWLVAGRLISGVVGATWAASSSCIADSFPDEQRGGAFGILGGAGAAGFVLGPVVGGLFGEFGTRLPFIFASSLALVSTVIGLALLKETLPHDKRRSFDPSRANPLGSLRQIAKTPLLRVCLLAIFFIQLSRQAHMSIWSYWGELKFGWTPIVSGLTISFYGILMASCQVLISGKAIARFGASKTAIYSSLFGLPSLIILAFAPSTSFVVLAIIIGSVAGIAFPALQSLMTARTSVDTQGELQGAISSAQSLTSIIGPVMMSQIFAFFAERDNGNFLGAPYLASSALLILAIGIMAINIDFRHYPARRH